MNRAEKLGAELVMMIRREADHLKELESTRDKITGLVEQIKNLEGGVLYQSAGEVPVIQETSDSRPGEETYVLTPVADAVAATLKRAQGVSPRIQCPARGLETSTERMKACPELRAHFHTADGIVHPIAL